MSAAVEKLARHLAAINSPLMWERTASELVYAGSDVMTDEQRDAHRGQVRSLLLEIREPGDGALRAACDNARMAGALPFDRFTADGFRRAWQAMIDHLLAD